MRYRVLPYRQGSKGAKALADALGGKVLKLEGSKFKAKVGDVIINWGNTGSTPQSLEYGLVHNFPECLKKATNKLNFFNLMQESASDVIPPFYTDKGSIPDDAYPIVCRQVLAGHSGDGIVIADTPDDLVDAPLYVKYVKKQDEYRIHVGKKDDEYATISTQRKARRKSVPDDEVNWKVRNLAGGFVFVREGVVAPECIVDAARRALEATGLDFGAVDVIYNKHEDRAYVLEINTAPGLEGQTVDDYVSFFTGEASA